MGIMNIISPVAVPTFFSISGFLFFRKERNSEDLWRYVWRVAKLYFIWTLIFLPLILFNYLKNEMLNVSGLVDFTQKLLFDGSYYHLWFLPSLIIAIIVTFYFSKILNNKALIVMAGILFILGTYVDTYSFISPLLSWEHYKAIFLTTRNGIFFGFPFVIIGKSIADAHYNKPRISLLIVSVAGTIIEGVYLSFILDKSIVSMSLSSLITIPMILSFALHSANPQIDCRIFRQSSTLIFCLHPMSIWFISHFFKGYAGAAIVLIITVIIAFAICKFSKNFKLLSNLW